MGRLAPWEPQWFSEIEQFPSEVLKHRFPDVPNLGDMTQLTQNPTFNERSIDLLVGGTPCQSFSVAGLRKGLADPRGNLMLTFLALADAKKPKWIVWENVPGVLSSNGGRDFGTFLGALGELGYGFAYRVLDAQHFGVAQRRRRVFVVGYLGDWRVAAAVLFERESLQGNIKPSRKKREEVTANAEGSVGATVFAGNQQSEIAATLQTTCDDYSRADGFNVIIGRVAQPIAFDTFNQTTSNVNQTIKSPQGGANESVGVVAQPIAFKVRGGCEGGGKGYLGQEEQAFTISATQDQQIAQPIAVDTYNYTTNDHTTQTIRSQSDTEHIGAVLHSIDFRNNRYNEEQIAGTLQSKESGGYSLNYTTGVHQPPMAIRRLTPKECERLQGFPDDWTKIPYRNKEADQCPDGPRYKACGNSMAVPVMRWIGQRIQYVENLMKEL